MHKLSQFLHFYIADRVTNDPGWKNVMGLSFAGRRRGGFASSTFRIFFLILVVSLDPLDPSDSV
jgi:hypothetical protein